MKYPGSCETHSAKPPLRSRRETDAELGDSRSLVALNSICHLPEVNQTREVWHVNSTATRLVGASQGVYRSPAAGKDVECRIVGLGRDVHQAEDAVENIVVRGAAVCTL